MSHRIWWLIAVVALGIGLSIEQEPQAGVDAATKAEAASAALRAEPLAARQQPARGG